MLSFNKYRLALSLVERPRSAIVSAAKRAQTSNTANTRVIYVRKSGIIILLHMCNKNYLKCWFLTHEPLYNPQSKEISFTLGKRVSINCILFRGGGGGGQY